MTLKTSLIITGDSSTAQKAVEDLNRSVAALGGSTQAAAAPIADLDAGQKGVAASAATAADAVSNLGATAGSAAQSMQDLGEAEQIAAGNAASAAGAIGNLAVAQNGVVTASGALSGATGKVQSGFEGVTNAGGLAGTALAGMTAQTGALAPVTDAATESVGGFVTSLLEGKVAQTATAAGGELLAGVLGGVLSGGIALAVSALGTLVIGLFQAEEASEAAEKAADDLASHVGNLGNYFDATTGRIKETNQALINFAILSANKRKTEAEDLQRGARAQGGSVLAAANRLPFGQQVKKTLEGYFTGGGIRGAMGVDRTGTSDIDQVFTQGKDLDARLRAIATSSSANAAKAGQILEQRATFVRAGRDIQKADAEVKSLLTGSLDASLRRSPAQTGGGSGGGGRTSGGGGRTQGGADSSPSGARAVARESAEASAAQRQLDQDLQGVIARYDPARKAASEYAAELERIGRLESAYASDAANPAVAIDKRRGITKDAAERYRAAAGDRYQAQSRELARTPAIVETERATKSIDDLIASMRGEIAAVQELDPVKRALLSVEKDLAKLAPEERAKREAAIEGAVLERDAIDDMAEATREAAEAKRMLQDAAMGAIDAIVFGGEKAVDVVKRLAKQIASAALEATLFGTGPLASLLKGGIGGGGGAGGSSKSPAAGFAPEPGKSEMTKELDRIFGTRGSFATSLKNAGIGSMAATVTGGNAVTGAIGGGLGGKYGGDLLGKLLPKLGDFAGPIGSIVGGILGGAIGSLFAKPKFGTASVSSTTGAAGSAGNGAEARSAATSLGGAVQKGVAQIAQSLGGELGKFNVAIGTFDGKYRVSTTGFTGSLDSKKAKGQGLVDFGKDGEAAAVAFAIMDAIKDGAVTGLSDRVAQALRSSDDIDAALKEAAKVQELEVLIGGISAQVEKAFRDFEATAKERVRIAQAYGFDVVAIEKRNAEDRVRIAEELMKGQVGSLQRLVTEMTSGNLFEGTALERVATLKEGVAKAKTDLEAGVEGAGDTLAGLYEQLVGASRSAYGTTSGYAAERANILDEARAAIARANEKITVAQAKTTDPALAVTNATLDEITDQNAKLLDVMEQNNALLSKLGLGGGTSSSFLQLAQV